MPTFPLRLEGKIPPPKWNTIKLSIEKSALFINHPESISGCDFVGRVEKLGSSVPADKVKNGEIRWAFIKGSVSKDKGAFAEYATTEWDLSGVVPDNVTPEEAAGIPIPFATAVRLYQPYLSGVSTNAMDRCKLCTSVLAYLFILQRWKGGNGC